MSQRQQRVESGVQQQQQQSPVAAGLATQLARVQRRSTGLGHAAQDVLLLLVLLLLLFLVSARREAVAAAHVSAGCAAIRRRGRARTPEHAGS